MTDFGGKLRQAREGRGISLRQIAATTKISVAALEALERNDVSKLPGGIFSRSFVRSYAVEVGLDPEATVREFIDRFQGEPVAAPQASSHIPDEEIAFERRKQQAARAFIGVLIVMLLLSTAIFYYVLRRRPDTSAPQPAVGTEPSSVASAAPSTPASSQPQGVASSGGTTPDGGTSSSAATGDIRVEIHPTGPCWVNAVVDGKTILARVVQPGERQALTVKELAVITVGDAGAFAFSIGGRAGRALGAAGEVKTARITRESIPQYVR